MGSRFSPAAAEKLRAAVREARGVEVFAIGDVEDHQVVDLIVTCRGQEDRVTALIDRPRSGQVVIHNHPSGDLTPSDADLALASMYGENGVGMVIVDSAVSRSNWVVEPHLQRDVPVDPASIERFFREQLPAVLPDVEPRQEQLDMALAVARSMSDAAPLVVEAGTGTGKSLAYLVPAALWALANDAKVVISTHTKALQAQLLSSDLRLLERAGLKVRVAVLQGRNNYLCRRRLALAVAEEGDRPPAERVDLDALIAWDQTTSEGARGDFPVDIDPALWERVESDSDLSLRVKCPHYAACHYYNARRRAAGAHLVVVNHALLLADLSVRDQGGGGVLPKFRRLVLDEAHHLEDAATGAVHRRVSSRAVARAVYPLVSTARRRGAIDRLLGLTERPNMPLFGELKARLEEASALAHLRARESVEGVRGGLTALAGAAIGPDGAPLRVTPEFERTARYTQDVAPAVAEVAAQIEALHGALDAVLAPFDEVKLPEGDAQPLLDVQRAARRLEGHAKAARAFLEESAEVCRWVEADRGRSAGAEATVDLAPIDVAPSLRRMLWEKFPGSVATSATLTVAGRFEFWQRRVGLFDATTAIYASPFDHARQALLAMPRDLPEPESDAFLAASTEVIVEAVRISGGGAFVLCTSYAAVEHYSRALRARLDPTWPVLAQGKAARNSLLDRFRADRRAVLVATDAFWEGVSVKGDGLRLVIIPRLPFRVPTEPLRLARYERIARGGGDAFRSFSLPEAVIKLRQGYGRLIRHRDDRGVVLLLDRRVHERSYGALMLRSLPPARRVSAPWRRVVEEMTAFFSGEGQAPRP